MNLPRGDDMDAMRQMTGMFYPLTANTLDATYLERMPCEALKPYIRCFWSCRPSCGSLVIPDVCMDAIFTVCTDGRMTASFCTMDEYGYVSEYDASPGPRLIFGIRFYAWAAILFTKNRFGDDSYHNTDDLLNGLYHELHQALESSSFAEICKSAEVSLLRRLDRSRINSTVMNAVYDTIYMRGTMRTADLAQNCAVSVRQLERLFLQNIGASPKAFSSVVRDQLIWQERCRKNTDIFELTEKYGYSDQAHLINDFKKRHTMTPLAAIKSRMSHFYNTQSF